MHLAELLRGDLERVQELIVEQYGSLEPLDAGCFVATGAGDSYAAALAAQYMGERVVAVDPADAAYGGVAGFAGECVLLALSVGGRTRLVVEAARRFRERGGRVVAVTASPESPLARAASETAVLVHGGLAGGVGAGRHIVMLAALARLLGRPMPVLEAIGARCPERMDACLYTGMAEGVSAALFTALKVYEVFGSPVHWWSLEQLVHAPIYASRPGEIVVYGTVGPGSGRAGDVVRVLRELGYTVHEVVAHGASVESNIVSQALWALTCLASSPHLPPRPWYRGHPGLEELTRLIYHEE